ncbi:MAG: bifunctional proline dehydrogenase/L-glutamate gamma-semialdehyde dehydrogenase PutA, partial [Pseudomonadota bacterium]|nr:bifunctional proline dehydrogenase/L-glutamate gamma-semialdehyde dehydrogenase PutA [Pseudomonadota bacterium]
MALHDPARLSPISRQALREAYRAEENACVAERMTQAGGASAKHEEAKAIAVHLIEEARKRKASGIDAFLHQYGLATEEGVALMCLAEALLRVPDAATADALIRDKIGDIDWAEHMGESSSTFVNAATFSLMLTGEVLERPEEAQKGMGKTLKRAVNRLGEPVIRRATLQAMRILGGQFVYGRTINESLKRAAPERARGLTHSFDMLGEAAMTFDDAERYRVNYHEAIARLVRESTGDVRTAPGISVKLSALHPKYTFMHADIAIADLLPIVRDLATAARDANIHFTIDAEEADRLELSMDLIEALARDDSLFTRPDGSRWEGFGLAIQAYQKRGVPMVDWTARLARKYDRKFFVRLVKGAYWDTEIKLSHVGGFKDFPVFTRKLATDVSYLACAEKMLAADDAIYPAFATHNAYTIGAIKAMAGAKPLEFQRLHGMGEDIYGALAQMEGNNRTNVRIYAPTGTHKDLLAYLVRRLLENGANSSFVNRMADAEVPASALATDPVADMAQVEPYRNPTIPLPADIFPGRKNSAGIDLSDPLVLEPLQERLAALDERHWTAEPTFRSGAEAEIAPINKPHDLSAEVGTRRDTLDFEVEEAITRAEAIQPGWDRLGGEKRAMLLEAAADLFEEHTDEFLSLCQREAGKT